MKVALCISGQARFLNEAYDGFVKSNILDKYNPNVFIHTWEIESSQIGKKFITGGGQELNSIIAPNQINKALKMYRPTRYKVEKQKYFEPKYNERAMPLVRSDNMYSMYYSVNQSNLLKKEYEQELGFKYDWVIRSRFDIISKSGPLKLEELDNNNMYIPSDGFNRVNGYVDSFAYSKSEIIDIYSDVYHNIDNIMETNNIRLCGEYVLRKHIDRNNIKVIETGEHKIFR